MVQYKGLAPLLAAIAHQAMEAEEEGGGSKSILRQHPEAQLTQYFERLFAIREEPGHAGCIREAAFNALLGYSSINFSETETAAIGQAVAAMEADGAHTTICVSGPCWLLTWCLLLMCVRMVW